MTKQDSTVTLLLALITIILILAGLGLYWAFDSRFYAHNGDFWKEFWLPTICSVEAALIAVLVTMLVLRRDDKTASDAQANHLADRLMSLIDDRLVSMRSEVHADIMIELLKRLTAPGAGASHSQVASNLSNLPVDGSNKERPFEARKPNTSRSNR